MSKNLETKKSTEKLIPNEQKIIDNRAIQYNQRFS